MKKLVRLVIIGLAVFAIGISPQNSRAAPGETSIKIDSDVVFETDNTPVDPQHPEVVNPTAPEDGPQVLIPGNGATGNGTRAFTINWATSFRFGLNPNGSDTENSSWPITIGSVDLTTFANPINLSFEPRVLKGRNPEKPIVEEPISPEHNPAVNDYSENWQTEGLANFVQVTDNRGQLENGYKLTVNVSEFVSKLPEETEGTKLLGAEMYLTGGRLIGLNEMADLAPENVLAQTTDLVGSGTHNVIEAEPGKGVGTWTLAWGGSEESPALLGKRPKSGVKLVVPVRAKPQADRTYTSTVTWELVSAPEIE